MSLFEVKHLIWSVLKIEFFELHFLQPVLGGHPVLSGHLQCCQLSWIIWETPAFEPFLPVSRLESEISWIIAKVCYFLYIWLYDKEISNTGILHCLSSFTVNIKLFLANSGMPLSYMQ